METREIDSTANSSLHLLPGLELPLRSMIVATERAKILISPVGTLEEAGAVGGDPITLVAQSRQ